jgi:hypothetical protein
MGARPQRSILWSWAWRASYRALRLMEPALRLSWRNGDLGITACLTVRGRVSGAPRSVLVGLLQVEGNFYVGHPNGEAGWVRDLEAADHALIWPQAGLAWRVRAQRLMAVPERTAVIRATARQQPWPGSLLYRISRRHIEAVGSYFRLEPMGSHVDLAT